MPLKHTMASTTTANPPRRVPLKSTYSQRRMSHFEFFLLATFLVSVLASFLAFTLLVPAVLVALDPSGLGLAQVVGPV